MKTMELKLRLAYKPANANDSVPWHGQIINPATGSTLVSFYTTSREDAIERGKKEAAFIRRQRGETQSEVIDI